LTPLLHTVNSLYLSSNYVINVLLFILFSCTCISYCQYYFVDMTALMFVDNT